MVLVLESVLVVPLLSGSGSGFLSLSFYMSRSLLGFVSPSSLSFFLFVYVQTYRLPFFLFLFLFFLPS